jgi:O-antigen/teichoic acid export membrane protein
MNFFKNVLLILRGSLIAQAASFAALPLLARLYAPADFGRYQIFQSILLFLFLSASLKYEVAILSAETDEYAFSLARLCLCINVMISAVTLALCGMAHFFAPDAVAKLGQALWLLPLAVLASGVFQTLTYLLLRSQAFGVSSAARGIQAVCNTSTALSLGAARFTGLGLIWADLLGKAAAAAYSHGKMVVRNPRYRLWRQGHHGLWSVARKFRSYPTIFLPGSLLDGIAISITPVLMYAAFGAVTSGQYALVDRTISLPLAVVTQAVSQVFMASFSSLLRARAAHAAEMFKAIVMTHLKIGAVPAVLLVICGPHLFSIVFGSQWQVAGEFSQIMAPLFLMSFLVAPVNMSLPLLEKLWINLAWYAFRAIGIFSAWGLVLALGLRPRDALILHVGVNLVAYLVLLFLMYRTIRAHSERAGYAQT